jgi:hypothetical protein
MFLFCCPRCGSQEEFHIMKAQHNKLWCYCFSCNFNRCPECGRTEVIYRVPLIYSEPIYYCSHCEWNKCPGCNEEITVNQEKDHFGFYYSCWACGLEKPTELIQEDITREEEPKRRQRGPTYAGSKL